MSAADKTKLDGIAAGATKTTVPTKVSAFTNDSGYQTSSQVQSAINSAMAGLTKLNFQIVTALPTTGVTGTFYLIADTHSDSNDAYDEYIWIAANSKFEKIGNTDVNLSGYVKASEMSVLTNAEIESAVTSAITSVFGS